MDKHGSNKHTALSLRPSRRTSSIKVRRGTFFASLSSLKSRGSYATFGLPSTAEPPPNELLRCALEDGAGDPPAEEPPALLEVEAPAPRRRVRPSDMVADRGKVLGAEARGRYPR